MTPRSDTDSPRRRSGSDQQLLADLRRIDGRPYGTYKSVIGDWDYGDFTLAIDRVQADPYAPPSALRAHTTPRLMGLPEEATASKQARIATADFLVRVLEKAIAQRTRNGVVRVAHPGQEILQRSSASVFPDRVELRLQVHLPARGRSILGHEAARIFDLDVPNVIMDAFDFVSDDEDTQQKTEELRAHIAAYEDHCALIDTLEEKGWVAFVADGSILARASGVTHTPKSDALPFTSPESLKETIHLPHAGTLSGMAIRPGVTLIVGGGYHGKSTLLSALQRGVYAHIPGDGRERVASLPDAMKIRAADGRAITGVDVSPFIAHLPTGADTRVFTTENASGSTSQAAALMEAVEIGSRLLLIDEDTSATNLLIRDERMRSLVAGDKEPITPLVDRIGALAAAGVSTIMVMGGSGDYLDVADTVLMLDSYRCHDVTAQARQVVEQMPRTRNDEQVFTAPTPRILVKKRPPETRTKTKTNGLSEILLDKQNVSLADLEQVVDPGQTEAIAWAMRAILEHFANGNVPLADLLDRLERQLNSEGLDAVTKFGARPYPAFLVRPRRIDIGAALNRYRGLRLGS